MTQPGGPAAIHGFLYQILHHINWLAQVRLAGTLDGTRLTNATLFLEPQGGGDAVAEADDTYIVEQYKTRQSRAWSVADLISVLRDLRRSVPPSLPANAAYRFVTDGRPGRLDTFDTFLQAVRSAGSPRDLDNHTKHSFSNSVTTTYRGFLDHLNAETTYRASKDDPAASADSLSVTFHLLGRFEMVFKVAAHTTAASLDQVLMPIAPPGRSVGDVRSQLVGLFLDRLAEGELRLDETSIDRLLTKADLRPDRLRELTRIAGTLLSLTQDRLSDRYDPRLDVRPEPSWPESKPVLLISGASGSGKTWRLANLLKASARKGLAATLIQSVPKAQDVLTQAARDYWHHGLHETTDTSLGALANALQKIDPGTTFPRFTIAVDDVPNADVARELVRQGWIRLQMRLAMTVSDDVAQSLLQTDADAVHCVSTGNFTPCQLDELLRREGHTTRDLPPDLQVLLRSPILAGIFLRLRSSAITAVPHTEYQIFDSFWERIAISARRADFGAVLALADKICQARVHPPRLAAIDAGLPETTVDRLCASGWVSTGETGEVGFTHDRLLNWATAKSLVRRYESRELSIHQLADILAGEDGDRTLFDRRMLGYVPMDVLWLLAADPARSKDLSPILVQLEHDAGDHGEAIYGELLPTLGRRAVPILRRRLDDIVAESPGDFRVHYIARGFAALANQAALEPGLHLEPLLRSNVRDSQNVALVALAATPVPNLLDHIWGLHRDRTASLHDDNDPNRHTDYETSFSAMRAAVTLAPAWLVQHIGASASNARFASELAYLLCAMDHADAATIWRETSHVLMANVPSSKPRSLIRCVARFRDREQLDFLIANLSHQGDFAAGSSLAALAVLDPVAALDRLADVHDFDRYLVRNQWLPVLLQADRNLTRRRILELAEAAGDSQPIVDLFWERPHEIDAPLLIAVLRDLECQLRARLNESLAAHTGWVGHRLDFLARVSSPLLLPTFEREAGGELERLILTFACGTLDSNSRIRNTARENAHVTLALIGGRAAAALIRRELASEHYWVRHSGLTWAALFSGNRSIRRRLFDLATRPAGVAYSSGDLLERTLAIRLLAAQGADAALVKAIEFVGPDGTPSDLPSLRARNARIPRPYTAHARKILDSHDPTADALLVALVVAGVSNDPDFIPTALSTLRNADPDGQAARLACIALNSLDDTSDTFAGQADRLLRSSSNSSLGLRTLARIGEQGRTLIADWLTHLASSSPGQRTAGEAIRVLYADPRLRPLAVEAAVDQCVRAGPFDDVPFDIAAESPNSEIRERVHRAAFQHESISPNRRLLAIEGLAKFDNGSAIAACSPFLRSYPRSAPSLFRLLIRIAPSQALQVLTREAVTTHQESVRNAIGRTLRRLDPNSVSADLLRRLGGPAPDRVAAAGLAAWIPVPGVRAALVRCANSDSAHEVRIAASLALEAHDREARVVDLLGSLQEAVTRRKWSLLLAVLEAGDAHLLSDPDDSLSLGRVLSRESDAPFRYYANQVLRRRRSKEP